MPVSRLISMAAVGAALFAAAPASAQFYFKGPDISGPRATGAEPGLLAQPLPGATPGELRAAMVWNLRAALNVAALQCQFAPTLLTLPNYNTILRDHRVELADSYTVLSKYFTRTHKTVKAAQTALDQYGTRVYSSFSAVHAQLTFCAAADDVAQEAVFTPRGQFGDLAAERMGEIRNSLTRWGEQQFPATYYLYIPYSYPNFADEKCWRKDVYSPQRCTKKR
ncbi:hypothetical protein [Sphingomonas suaedae]|uniref:hypothetical protein n=1 Tax=Sphingomonas suaedae TaxID=2599297 RepID=UPI001EF05DF8|nr:hypothetical protein [Sphingomonas suaedae]